MASTGSTRGQGPATPDRPHWESRIKGNVAQLSLWLWTIYGSVTHRWVRADDETHRYNDGEPVVVWTDKVGPYNNPQETYSFEQLGLCELPGKEAEPRDPVAEPQR